MSSLMQTNNPEEDNSPYLGLRPFKEFHQDRFFGRLEEIHILHDKVLANRLTLLVAASGVGKSSLLQAGVMPALRVSGLGDLVYHNDWAGEPSKDLKSSIVEHYVSQQVINEDYEADLTLPLDEFLRIHSMLGEGTLIILLDQFEEFFYYQRFSSQRIEFIKELSAAVRDLESPCTFVFSMREDFAMELEAFKPWLSGVFDQVYRIEKLSLEAAREAIVKPLEGFDFRYESELVDTLLEDLGQRERQGRLDVEKLATQSVLMVEPPHLQIVCQQLWLSAADIGGRSISENHYQALGRADGILDDYFLKKMSSFSAEQKRLASKAFDLLVSQQGTKMSYPLDDLVSRLLVDERALKETLELLHDAAILQRVQRQEQFWYELYHDIFAKSINEWNRAFKVRQLRKRFFVGLGSAVLAGAVVFSGYDFWVNYSERYLRLGRETVSDRVEVYQGDLGSWDLFSQRRFLFETDYERKDIEADKRFETLAVGDLSRTYAMQVGQLKLVERYLDYAQAGLFFKSKAVNEAIEKSGELDLQKKIIQQLAHVRVQQNIDVLIRLSEQSELTENTLDSFAIMKAQTKIFARSLQHNNFSVRLKAKKILDYSQYNSKAIPSLLKTIEQAANTRSNIHDKDAGLLVKLHPHKAISKLLKLLENSDWHVANSATKALIRLQAQEAISGLLKLLENSNSDTRARAVEVLGNLQVRKAIPNLLKLLKNKDSDWNIRSNVTKSFIRLQANEVVPELLKLLEDRDSDWNIRENASEALVGLQAYRIIPNLLKLLGNDNSGIRAIAVEVLSGLQAREAIPALVKRLQDSNLFVRLEAAKALGGMQAHEAIPDLLKLLKDREWRVRAFAAQALGTLQAYKANQKFIKLLGDNKSRVRENTINALAKVHAGEMIPDLLKLLEDNDSDVSNSAAQALGTLQAYEAIPELLKLVEHRSPIVRIDVAEALCKLQAHEVVIPRLLKLLEYEDNFIRKRATQALGTLKKPNLLPILLKLLEKDILEVQQASAEALSRMQQKPKLLTQWQQQQLKSLAEKVKTTIYKANIAKELGFIYTQYSVKLLLDLLKDKHPTVIKNSLTALGNIGEYHPQWLQAHLQQLLAFTKSPRPDINIAALKTLAQIQQFKGIDKAENLIEFKQTIQQHLLNLINDKQQAHYIRVHAINALSQSPKATAVILEHLKDKTETDLHYFIYRWLGDNGDQTAIKELQKHLQTLAEEKQQWRKQRDQANQNLRGLEDLEGLNTKITQKKDKSWQKGYLEYKIAYAIAQIDPEQAGIKLLEHPLYQVRQAAIRALSTKTNGELIKKIFNTHQNFNEKSLPSPLPYAAYRTLDKALHTLESTGTQTDLNILKKLRADDRLKPEPINKNNPSTQEQQRDAIKQRLDWTITELSYTLKKAAEEKQKTEISATK